MRVWSFRLAAACLAFVSFETVGRAQNDTTAALAGNVTDAASHEAVAGARITLRQAETGDTFTARTNASGQFFFVGLRVGSAYALRVTAADFEAEEIPALSLALGEERQLDIALSTIASRTHHLERMTITAARERLAPGTSSTLSESDIEQRPTLDRSINDYATADPRITLLDDETGEISAAGQNVRFNSLQIDGIRLDDQFGLSASGLPSQGNPFSMETIAAVSVELAPYDVSRGGFTGASINAVTKSGSNRLSGSAYYSYRNEKFRAPDPRTGTRTPFTDKTYGFTLGGPLIRNRLFFFASWERSVHTDPAREPGFIPDAAAIERILLITKEKFNYDAGSLAEAGEKSRTSDRSMLKLDWRINAQHRLSARYTRSHGTQPNFANYSSSGETSLNTHWYESAQDLDAWSAQLFSKWLDAFQTEIVFAQQNYTNIRTPNSRWPQVRIGKVPASDSSTETGVVWFGADSDSMLNELTTKNLQAKISAKWLLGKHRIEFGGETLHSDFDNRRLQYAWGAYSFASIDDYEIGKMSGYTLEYMLDGGTPGVKWGYSVNTVFLQDTWRPFRTLTLTAGARFDYPTMDEKPRENPLVEQTFGVRNDATIDGAYTLAPRVSVAWKPVATRILQLRGGAGIFQGRIPGVWMSNAFVNDGLKAVRTTTKPDQFVADIYNQPQGPPTSTRMRVDLMDDALHLPTVARANLALDFELPWQNFVASLEWLYSRAQKSLVYRDLNLKRVATGPDGRPIYGEWKWNAKNTMFEHNANSQYANEKFDDVFLLTNADKRADNSVSSYLTLSLKRPLRNHWGASIAYTRGHATEVSPFTASTANANFSTRMSIDPNSDETGTSNTEVRDRIVTTLSTKFALIRNFNTTIQLLYDAHSGRPYSFTFRNDGNGDGHLNDLFYVPTSRNDPKVYWRTPVEADAFFAYLANNNALRRFAGQIVPRNTERSKFQHRFDLHLSQEIPFWKTLRSEIFCDLLNFTNLLNRRWGQIYQYASPYNLPVAYGYYDAASGQYFYSYQAEPKQQALQAATSRWRIQAGVKIKF